MIPAEQVRPATPPGVRRTHTFAIAAALVLAIVLAYQPTWRAEFIWDDDAHLTAHPCIVGPLGFKEIWTNLKSGYFPLVLTQWWLVHKVFGLNPLVYHLIGVAFHVACTLLLWAVLRRLRVPGAPLGAALWGLHPVQVESVAWVSETINTQSGAFFLLAIWFGARWLGTAAEGGGRRGDWWVAFGCAVGAMLSKPSTVMLPVVLGLTCWWLRGKIRLRDATWLAPFFIVALAISGMTILEQKVQGASGPEWNQTLAERVIIAGNVVWFYLGKLIWPNPLSFIYPRWTIDAANAVAYVPVIAAVAGMLVLGWRRDGVLRPVFFAAAYYLVMLFPVLGFFDVYFFRYSFVADHFQFLAGMGPLALAGAGLTVAWRHSRQPALRRAIPAVCGLCLVTFAVLSWRQARHYVNDETLWRATLETNPRSLLAHNNLAVIFAAENRLAEAVHHYQQALAINPALPETHFSLARALAVMPGRRLDAVSHFERALQLKPDFVAARFSLANSLATIPERRLDAISHYELALREKPDNAEAHSNLGLLLAGVRGRLADAIHHGEAAIKLKPDLAEAHFNLANTLAVLPERLADALRHYETALRLKPDHVKAHINLGLAYSRIEGRLPDAIRHYEAALALDPRSAVTYNNLAIALVSAGRFDDALRHLEMALEIDPGYADARNNLSQLRALRPNP
jgi:protein O-mannosyl-transferase